MKAINDPHIYANSIIIKRYTLIILFLSLTTFTFANKSNSLISSQFPEGRSVIFKDKEMFKIYTGNNALNIDERASVIELRLEQIYKSKDLNPDSLKLIQKDNEIMIKYKNIDLIQIMNDDSLATNQNKLLIANEIMDNLKKEFFPFASALSEKQDISNILKITALIFIIIIITYIIFRMIQRLWIKLIKWIDLFFSKHSSTIVFKGIKIIAPDQLEYIMKVFLNILKFIIHFVLIYNMTYFILLFIPATHQTALNLKQYLSKPLITLFKSFLSYFPNIIFITITLFVAKYVIKFLRYFFDEIEKENIKFKNFYPDWADSTFHIIKFLIYFFVAVIIFPYLPGSDSPAFKGISIFVGVIFSLGSSSAIANMVAGIILTYMRAFKVGDIVKIGDTIGELRESSLLVIRIKTFKNVEITIPNAIVLNGQILDYSHYCDNNGLIVHSKITIGYDVPWNLVHKLLIQAAKSTEGILKDKDPYVLQIALNDFSVEYEINAFTNNPKLLPRLYSDLHQNIQNEFRDANVEIMSPIYNAVRNGNETTIPNE